MAEEVLINRVAESGLITINLELFFPEGEVLGFDLAEYLFMGMILKEKDFRESLKSHDWSRYSGKNLAVYCSADAIIPMWAYMLVGAYAAPFARDVFQGSPEQFLSLAYAKTLDKLDVRQYEQKRIVIKGCSDRPVPAYAYLELTKKLQPVAQSIMYGEPCSTVPIFKRPRV